MRIFNEADLRTATEERLAVMCREVTLEPKNQLLNMNEAEYIEYLVHKYTIEPLVFLWDGIYLHFLKNLFIMRRVG